MVNQDTKKDLGRSASAVDTEVMDPADSDLLRDELKGHTVEHAIPPRLEDEGQSGG